MLWCVFAEDFRVRSTPFVPGKRATETGVESALFAPLIIFTPVLGGRFTRKDFSSVEGGGGGTFRLRTGARIFASTPYLLSSSLNC